MNTATPTLRPSFGQFITLDQAASLLNVSKRTVMREIARGKFPKPAKVGRTIRTTIQDVETYAASVRA